MTSSETARSNAVAERRHRVGHRPAAPPTCHAAAARRKHAPAGGQIRPATTKVFEELVVPADSVLGLQLETTLSSERAQVEDRSTQG